MLPSKHTASRNNDEKKKKTNLFLPIDIWLITGFQRLKMYYANPCTSHIRMNINCKSVNSASSSENYWLFLKETCTNKRIILCVLCLYCYFPKHFPLLTAVGDTEVGWIGLCLAYCWVPQSIQSCSLLNSTNCSLLHSTNSMPSFCEWQFTFVF